MYGCNNFCTYCIVPYVRGRERSRDPEEIIEEAKQMINDGFKEIMLLGQNVNSYGKDESHGVNFAKLIRMINDIEGDFRIRFMSNHPKDITEKLVKVIASSKKICNYVHLPLQSGSTAILQKMNRRYTHDGYLEKVNLIRKYLPSVSISTDIMVGFPGETEQDFLDTLKMVKDVRFDGAFTFVYSRRKGTKADLMTDQIDEEIKKQRIIQLVDLQNSINREKSLTYTGKTVEVLCEDYDSKKDVYLGRDEYNRMIYFPSKTNIIGKFVMVKITETGGISLYGELV
jgi:tRNA-2-methylthio-N6-dimethylallyladenosine synthase